MSGHAPGMTIADQALFTAASRLNADNLRQALESGARADFLDGDRQSPLHALAMRDCEPPLAVAREMVALLLQAGAELHQKDQSGRNPLQHACANGSAPLARALVERGASLEGGLYQAIKYGRSAATALTLIELGADASAPCGPLDQTPEELERAAWGGSNPAILALLEGAALNASVKAAPARPSASL